MIETHAPRILIMGGGQQGKVIAEDLSQDFYVDIADINKPDIDVRWISADLSDVSNIIHLCTKYDLVINALPEAIASNATYIVTILGISLVDLSFHNISIPKLEKAIISQKNTVSQTIIVDAGWAPGLSDLIIGREISESQTYRQEFIKSIKIYVGGVAHNRKKPYGHVNTWSIKDMEQEYIRPAKYIYNSQIKTDMPMEYPLETVQVKGYSMEAFISDGLRTLINDRYVKYVPNMIEKTLRWPGHIKKVKPLIENKTFVETLTNECNTGNDMALMKIVTEDSQNLITEFSLVEYGTKELSGMTKITAYTCAAFARLLLSGKLGLNKLHQDCYNPNVTSSNAFGLFTPSQIGEKEDACNFVLEFLRNKGVNITELLPK